MKHGTVVSVGRMEIGFRDTSWAMCSRQGRRAFWPEPVGEGEGYGLGLGTRVI